MTQFGEAVFTPSPEPKDPKEDEKETINIRFSVFFDGTLNNRNNIDSRLVSAKPEDLTEEERISAADLKQKMKVEDLKKAKGIYKKQSGESSYEGGYSNIAKMEVYVKTKANDKEVILKSYIEGPGSRNNKSDKFFGYSIGTGKSGVTKKVKEGLKQVAEKIEKKHRDKNTKIKILTLDVFGFSRGAAAARYFIHKALFNDSAVKRKLEQQGFQVEKVEICFVGLFDTVSSHGLSFSNDTSALNLDAVKHATTVLQLSAADEHRENFSLTTIDSAVASGIQLYLPGVHSDIGGSYREGDAEKQDLYWDMGPGAKNRAEAQKLALIDAGWYHEHELTVDESSGMEGFDEAVLHAERSSISNQYSRIPLHIMAGFARDEKITIKSKLERDEKIPAQLGSAEGKLKQYVNQHKSKGAFSSTMDHWRNNAEGWLHDMRHDYFHFSARLEIGQGPRYIDGRRQRMEYDG